MELRATPINARSNMFAVYKVKDGVRTFLWSFSHLATASGYSLAWSNENNLPTMVYDAGGKVLRFTHRISENKFQLYKS